MPSLYVVQANPVPGREQEFRDWYDDRHLADVLAVPGFLTARRFERSPHQPSAEAHRHPHRSLVLYELDDVHHALAGLTRALAGGMEMSGSLAGDRVSVVYDRVAACATEGRGARGARSLLAVLAGPPPGRERLTDALALPGLVAASRYIRSDLQRESRAHDYPYRSLTLYEIEGGPCAVLDALAGYPAGGAAPGDGVPVLFDQVTERTRR